MREALKPQGMKRRGPGMQVSMGTETLSHPGIGVPDGRVDIAISFPAILEARHDHDPHAIVECKRIAGDDRRLRRRYVGRGIDRFVSGQYAARHVVGCMAGYLESSGADLATQGINQFLNDKNRPDELLGPAMALNAKWARSSRHARRIGGDPIDLHHAFLEFT